jgi:ATP-dependent DNA ligase
LATIQSFNLPNKIHLVETTEVYSLDAAQKIFEEYLANGQEGIILKSQSGVWENKRAKHQIKFKGELECDLRIVAIQPGTGKYEGMLGAILCESADGVLKVSVGSGFNDDQRNQGDELVGKIVAVKYNAKIVNKQGEVSLFLPIFIEIRNDKDVADLNKDIK